MKRTLVLMGIAALTVVGAAAAAAQAQGSDAADQRGRPALGAGVTFEQRGPQRPLLGQGQGQGQGQGLRRGRGPGGQAGPGRPGGPGRRGGPGFGLRGLDLTDEQKAQIKAIHEQTRQAVDNILTPEQKAKRRGGR